MLLLYRGFGWNFIRITIFLDRTCTIDDNNGCFVREVLYNTYSPKPAVLVIRTPAILLINSFLASFLSRSDQVKVVDAEPKLILLLHVASRLYEEAGHSEKR
jgi:hypothetical protein